MGIHHLIATCILVIIYIIILLSQCHGFNVIRQEYMRDKNRVGKLYRNVTENMATFTALAKISESRCMIISAI